MIMKTKKTNSNWMAFFLNGLIAIVYGVFAIINSGDLIKILLTGTGIILAVIGLICLFVALHRKKNMNAYGMLLFESIVMMAFGIVMAIWPQKISELLVFVIAFWTIIIGAFQLLNIIRMREITNKVFFILSAILSITFGIILIFRPFESAKVFIIVTGIIALLFGITTIMFAFNVRQLERKNAKEMETEASKADVPEKDTNI